jgi:hypothetical protein
MARSTDIGNAKREFLQSKKILKEIQSSLYKEFLSKTAWKKLCLPIPEDAVEIQLEWRSHGYGKPKSYIGYAPPDVGKVLADELFRAEADVERTKANYDAILEPRRKKIEEKRRSEEERRKFEEKLKNINTALSVFENAEMNQTEVMQYLLNVPEELGSLDQFDRNTQEIWRSYIEKRRIVIPDVPLVSVFSNKKRRKIMALGVFKSKTESEWRYEKEKLLSKIS